MREVAWLARREMWHRWRSYLATAIFMAAFGFGGAMVTGDFSEESVNTAAVVGADIFFVCICPLLAFNWAMKDGLQLGADPFSKRLYFLRSLPVSVPQIVASRVLSMAPALVLNSVAFFGALYAFSGVMGSSVSARLGAPGYLWFALMWVGYALVWGGANLYVEQGTSGSTYMRAQFAMFVPLAALIVVLEWALDPGIIPTLIDLGESYGLLSVAPFLLVGTGTFAAWAMATARRIARRDLQT